MDPASRAHLSNTHMMRFSTTILGTSLTCLTACIAPPISVGVELDESSDDGSAEGGSTSGSDGSASASSSSGLGSGSGTDTSSESTGEGPGSTGGSTGPGPASSSTETGIDPSTSTGIDTATATDGSSTTSGEEATPCDQGFEVRSCVLAGGGMPEGWGCQWVELERLDVDGDFCSLERDVGGRCIPTRYQGEGCVQAECGDHPGVYYRTLRDGSYETFANPGLCEYQPAEYTLCLPGDPHPACECLCSEAAFPPGLEETFVSQGGCADLVVFALDASGTTALHLRLDDGFVAQAQETQGAVETEITAWRTLELVVGADLDQHFCNDVVSDTVTSRYTATAGTLHVVVEPSDDDLATATITLHDVTFASEAGNAVLTIEEYTFEDVVVGWFPG